VLTLAQRVFAFELEILKCLHNWRQRDMTVHIAASAATRTSNVERRREVVTDDSSSPRARPRCRHRVVFCSKFNSTFIRHDAQRVIVMMTIVMTMVM